VNDDVHRLRHYHHHHVQVVLVLMNEIRLVLMLLKLVHSTRKRFVSIKTSIEKNKKFSTNLSISSSNSG
jgi:hypothetical protein